MRVIAQSAAAVVGKLNTAQPTDPQRAVVSLTGCEYKKWNVGVGGRGRTTVQTNTDCDKQVERAGSWEFNSYDFTAKQLVLLSTYFRWENEK